MENSPKQLELSLDKIIDETNYSLSVLLDQSTFLFTVTKPLDSIYWEGYVNYPEYQKKNVILMMWDKEIFFAFIKKSLQSDKFILTTKNTSLILEFSLEIGIVNFFQKYPLNISLDKKVKDISDNVSMIATHLKKLENNFDQFKNKLEVGIKDCEENTREKIKDALEEFKQINKSSFENLKNEFSSIIDKNRSFLRGNVINPILNDIPSNIIFANCNKTIEKVNQDCWVGVRFHPIPAKKGIFEFSISLDDVRPDCDVAVGFCLESHNGSSGFYKSNCLAVLDLTNGKIYSNSGNATHLQIRGSNGLIFTSVIDIDSKIIFFKLNGHKITWPVPIKLEENQMDKICPCVDMHTVGDKVSLIYVHEN